MSDPNQKSPEPNPPPGGDGEQVSPASAVRMLREMAQQNAGSQDTLVNEAPTLIGRTLGQYRILTKIGQGGMGMVFKAEDTALKREVALKVLWINPLDDPRIAERFMREARCLARLSHPNLLHVYNVGSEGDLRYFAMELLRGRTLAEALRSAHLTVPEALNMTGQLLSALDYVHHQGITHRDIKSGNIMLCDSRVVLMDFGLAKEEHATGLTSEGVVLGTPEYMTPEQADGRTCGPPTDIYSLGVVLFEALTGRVPFLGRSALSIIKQHLDEKPPTLASRLPGIDPQLDQIVARCLAKDPKDRYADCSAMAVALLRLIRTPELLQLAGNLTAGDTLIVDKNALLQPTVPLPSGPSASGANRKWLWLAAAFALVLLFGFVLIRASKRRPVPARGQVVRVESGPHEGQTLRWEFESKGANPASWVHRVETLNPDGTWGQAQPLTHAEFKTKYPRISLQPAEGTSTP
jgi:serine/threonine-protein kinase